MSKLLTIVFFALFFLLSCTDDSGVNGPSAPERVSVSFIGKSHSITAPPGATRDLPLTVSVRTTTNAPVAGVKVALSTQPAMGEFIPSEPVTDASGIAQTTYRVALSASPNLTINLNLHAETDGGYGDATLYLNVTALPANLSLFADPADVNAAPAQDIRVLVFAAVTDADGATVPETELAFTLEPAEPGGVVFGSINSEDWDYDAGITRATFHSWGETGKLLVHCSTTDPSLPDPLTATALIEIRGLGDRIAEFSLIAVPDKIVVPLAGMGESQIIARITDQWHSGVPKVQVNFRTTLGTIGEYALTDSLGQAHTTLLTGEDAGEAIVTALIPGTDYSDTLVVPVQGEYRKPFELEVFSDTDEIYADNDSLTFATLTAQLKDADGQGIGGVELRFSTTQGAVPAVGTTDASGVCYNVFNDLGEPSLDEDGNPVPAIVTVKYEKMDLEVSKEIFILPRNPITIVNLYVLSPRMTVGDSILVSASCFQENGQRAPDGTEVHFYATLGHFSSDVVRTTGGTGRAESYFIAPTRTGTAILSAYVINADGDTAWSNDFQMAILPGPPSQFDVEWSRSSLVTGEYADITVTVSDTFGNPVPGVLISFTSTLGSFNPNYTVTDTLGRGWLRFYAGSLAGFATITVMVNTPSGPIYDQTTIQIVAGSPASITLEADPPIIQVRETGGRESSTLTATVRDQNGNLVTTPVIVYFEFIRQPAEPNGCNFNNHGQLDSAWTINGVARVAINSGRLSGLVIIKAYTWRDLETRLDRIEAFLIIQVVSGPPELMDIDVNNNGVDAGGGAWAVEVSARVYDFWRNPVADRIPVAFTVDPDIATINPAYTGNVNMAGDSLPGLAFTVLTYNSNNTFDTLTIRGLVENPNNEVTGELLYTLPLQQGELQLNCDPTNWMFDRSPPGEEGDLCLISVWAVVTDGHQRLINNAPVWFTTNRGTFWWRDIRGRYNEYEPPDPAIKYTEGGAATVYLRGTMDDFFLDIFTLEVTVQINASLVGYDVYAEPAFIYMTRH